MENKLIFDMRKNSWLENAGLVGLTRVLGKEAEDLKEGSVFEISANELDGFGEKYFETSRHYYECFVGEPRTFEIGIRGRFETWTGIMIPWGAKFVLVGSDEDVLESAFRLKRIGYSYDPREEPRHAD